MRLSLIYAVCLLLPATLLAQGQRRSPASAQDFAERFEIQGLVVDQSDGIPLAGAHVGLVHARDTTRVFRTATDEQGAFRLLLPRGTYDMYITFLGYKPIEQSIRVSQTLTDLGRIEMEVTGAMLEEVTVTTEAIMVRQKGDTLLYQAAAFRVNPDASAEDLIRRMPGFTMDAEGLRAQGEEVQRVLVDGQRFFGDDPNIALRNLPAEMIESIEVFDELSDQAQLTGFDDGQTIKTVNIVTRLDRRSGQFGRLYSGYGMDERYQAGLTTNLFMDQRRISILGMSNNINQQNFSTEDLSGLLSSGGRPDRGMRGMGGRGGGAPGGTTYGGGSFARGDFLIGQQMGNNTTHSMGVNYTDRLAEGRVNANGSYFFNRSTNETERFSDRQYLIDESLTQWYADSSFSGSKNQNHRFNARITYDINENHSLIITPRFSIQQSEAENGSGAQTTFEDSQLLTSSFSQSMREWDGYTASAGLVHRARLGKAGRSISSRFNLNANNNEALNFLDAISNYYEGPVLIEDVVDQLSDSRTTTTGFSGNLVYTEPLFERGLIQFSYNLSHSNNASDRLTNSYDIISESYSIFENERSNELTNGYLTQRAGMGYRFNGERVRINLELAYQDAALSTDQRIPYELELDKSFRSLLPSAQISYSFSRSHRIHLRYRTSTSAPSVNQLQDMVDNTNPLLLTGGNPDLKQSFTHFLNLRYQLNNLEKNRHFMLFLVGSLTNDFVSTSTLIARQDTLLPNGYMLPRGAQFSQPVNQSGFANLRGSASYTFVLRPIRSNLGLRAGAAYRRSPGLVNGMTNVSHNRTYNGGVSVDSNISENVDFSLSYNAHYGLTENSLRPQLDNAYFYHIAGMRLNFIFLNGWVFRSELSHFMYTGLAQDYDEDYILLNLNVGRKLLRNRQGEITLGVYDLLDQNSSVSRNVTGSYIEDVRSNVLNRFLMLTFTYNIRHFRLD